METKILSVFRKSFTLNLGKCNQNLMCGFACASESGTHLLKHSFNLPMKLSLLFSLAESVDVIIALPFQIAIRTA